MGWDTATHVSNAECSGWKNLPKKKKSGGATLGLTAKPPLQDFMAGFKIF